MSQNLHGCGKIGRAIRKESRVAPLYRAISGSLAHETARTATLKVVHQDLTHFVVWWEHTRRRTFDPVLLRYEDFRDWRLARQREDGAAPATINRGLASLRGYCRWASLSHLLTENPAIGIEDVPTDPLAPRSLPPEAIDALLRAARA
jgi:site-specific recombinase XerD